MIGPGSAFGQDRWVLDVLGEQRGGFFIDSGASDGVRGSNTLVLERDYGWTGICVEPNPRFFARLTAARRCHCINACLYDRDGDVEFVDAEVLGGIIDDYPPSLVKQAQASYGIEVDTAGRPRTVVCPARSILGVLEECDAPRVIDYWSLDTEGSELSILRAFPFDRYDVRTITVEHNWLPAREQIHAFLTALGYLRVRELAVDDCYVRGVHPHIPAWRSAALRRRSG
jgi:FkbM family methyltransferase